MLQGAVREVSQGSPTHTLRSRSKLNPSCSSQHSSLQSCACLCLLASSPLTLSPVSNLSIIFAFRYPHPLQGAAASWVSTRSCVCAAHLHACVPLNAVDLPGASGHASLHKTPTPPPSGERSPKASHPTALRTNSPQDTFSPRHGGRRENKYYRSQTAPSPLGQSSRPFSRATKSHWRRKYFEIPSFPSQVRALSLSPIYLH